MYKKKNEREREKERLGGGVVGAETERVPTLNFNLLKI